MKKSIPSTKLILSSETLKALLNGDLAKVQGGQDGDPSKLVAGCPLNAARTH